jgi:hypothetical protein
MRNGFMPGAPVSRAVRIGCTATLCLFTAACFATPEWPLAGPDPSDPKARVRASTYQPVLSGYTSQRPVDPAPWREQMDRVAPAPRQ